MTTEPHPDAANFLNSPLPGCEPVAHFAAGFERASCASEVHDGRIQDCAAPECRASLALIDALPRLQLCEWFANCGHVATGTIAHPRLGDVPACDTCGALCQMTITPFPTDDPDDPAAPTTLSEIDDGAYDDDPNPAEAYTVGGVAHVCVPSVCADHGEWCNHHGNGCPDCDGFPLSGRAPGTPDVH